MIFIGKLLQGLFAPLSLFLILAGLGFWLLQSRKNLGKKILIGSFVGLFLFSNRWVANVFVYSLESVHPPKPLASYPTVDAIIVLGGSLSRAYDKDAKLEENAGSRLVPATLLYKMGKAKKLVVSGGLPYRRYDGVMRTEADDMATFLVSLGVPEEAIEKEGLSRNTEENAIGVSKILREKGWEKTLLVTSAFHMRRAMFLFEKVGISPIAVPVGNKGLIDPAYWYLYLFPSALALELSTLALKEHVGYWWGHL